MTDIFYLAAFFSNMEQACRAYTPIQELLRRHDDTDLSVFRVKIFGLPFVVVLGVQPPAPILDGIKNALVSGTLAPLPAEAVAWLFQRREQREQRVGFSEGHYTRETGPRYRQGPRIRRRRVSILPVTWQDEVPTREEAQGSIINLQTGEVTVIPPQFVGVCDWCTAELAPPISAIHNFAVELTFPDGFVVATGGQWATCTMCQDRLRLKEGDTQVSFEAVDRLWRIHGSRYLARYFGENARRLRIRTFYAEELDLEGPGQYGG